MNHTPAPADDHHDDHGNFWYALALGSLIGTAIYLGIALIGYSLFFGGPS